MSALYGTYARSELAFERGEGVRLFAQDGTAYLDFNSGIGVNALGHADPHLVATLKAAADKVWHTSNVFTIPEQERLAQRLVERPSPTPCSSPTRAPRRSSAPSRRRGTTSGPRASRTASRSSPSPARSTAGRSATIAAGGNPHYLEGFGPPLPGFKHTAPGDLKAVEALITPKTCAILIEPVQGEGGVTAMTAEFMRGLRALCDKHGMLLILDEVQCGYGRTGKFFAHEWAGITPDIMAVAKGIGGGFPLGACLATGEVAKSMVPGTHGSTYGGNPLACAIGNAVLDRVLGARLHRACRADGPAARLASAAACRSASPITIARAARQGPASPASRSRRRCAISSPGCATTISCSRSPPATTCCACCRR